MSVPRTAKERAATAAIAEANAAANRLRAEARIAYDERTAKLYFTKDFNTALENVMRDRLAPAAERILAYIKRYSWGEYSLFAIGEDGFPKYQRDIELEIGIVKQTVSKTVKYLQQRGHVGDQAKLLVPSIEYSLAGPPDGGKTRDWETFVDQWKVAHSSDFAELEVARSTVSRIRAVVRSDYKIWRKQREQETSAAGTLCKTSESNTETTAGSIPLTPLEENIRRHQTRKPQPETHPVDGGMQLKALLEARALLFREIAHMQKAFKNTSFAKPPLDPNCLEHQTLINLILTELGNYDEEYLIGYLVWVAAKFKGIGLGGKRVESRAPGKPKGPDGLGLLVNWARDYSRVNAERRRGAGQ